MGLFDLLSRDARAKSALERNIKRTVDKYAQSVDRFAAMDKLREAAEQGNDEALAGLCRRFAITYDKSIEDADEKEWVVQTLVGFGQRAVTPIKQYALSAESVSYPLRVVERLGLPEAALELLDALIGKEPPGYTRDPSRKIQIMTTLGEWGQAPQADTGDRLHDAAAMAARAIPYLKDFDEGVRFATIETLDHIGHESARLPLLDALVRPQEESRRITARVVETIVQHGWTITEKKDEVMARVADLGNFGLAHDKLVDRSAVKGKGR